MGEEAVRPYIRRHFQELRIEDLKRQLKSLHNELEETTEENRRLYNKNTFLESYSTRLRTIFRTNPIVLDKIIDDGDDDELNNKGVVENVTRGFRHSRC